MDDTIPNPGSDAARALIPACECHPGDNGVTHPMAGDPGEAHHGQAVKPFADTVADDGTVTTGWVINPACPVHAGRATS